MFITYTVIELTKNNKLQLWAANHKVVCFRKTSDLRLGQREISNFEYQDNPEKNFHTTTTIRARKNDKIVIRGSSSTWTLKCHFGNFLVRGGHKFGHIFPQKKLNVTLPRIIFET